MSDWFPCSHNVPSYFGGRKTCSNNGKMQRTGKWYCGIHDPERKAKKEAERDSRWARRMAINNAGREVDEARANAADLVESGVYSRAKLRVAAEAIFAARRRLEQLRGDVANANAVD